MTNKSESIVPMFRAVEACSNEFAYGCQYVIVGDQLAIHDKGDYYLECKTETLQISLDNGTNWATMQEMSDKASLIERESEQKYTRKQVQKACANAYQRGVDNRPYLEKFDDWVEDEPNQPKSEEV